MWPTHHVWLYSFIEPRILPQPVVPQPRSLTKGKVHRLTPPFNSFLRQKRIWSRKNQIERSQWKFHKTIDNTRLNPTLLVDPKNIYKRPTHHKYMMIIKILFTINIFRRKSRFSASLVQQLVCCWFMFQGSAKWNFTYCRKSRGSREMLTFWPTFYCLLRFSSTCSTHRRQRRRAKYIEQSSFPFATQ